MENKYRILVTGACGVTSRSVVRSLNVSPYFKGKCEFVGTDVCYNLYGIYEGLYSKVYKVPAYNDPDYRSTVKKIIDENELEYAIIMPEPEVYYWCENPFDIKFMRIPVGFSKIALSKRRLYETLDHTNLTPKFQIVDREKIREQKENVLLKYPVWIRDYSEGTTSGRCSFLAKSYDELCAWLVINPHVDTFMLSEYLPGRNLACFLLYNNGRLLKYGVAQRIEYLMGKVSVSGITGNTSRGKLLNDEAPFDSAKNAVKSILTQTGEVMNGLVVADLKEDSTGTPLVTEINIRHVAFTSSFANAGLNFSEYQMLCMLNRQHDISPGLTKQFPKDNLVLRDVDGLPIYLEHYKEIGIGECHLR